jgi:diguanylate cyclase (GGDEF)-like protein
MLDIWRRKLAIIQEWSGVERACVPPVLVALIYTQYLCWVLYCVHLAGGQLVNAPYLLAQLPVVLGMVTSAVLLVLGGLLLRKYQPDAEWFQHLAANFYGGSLMWGGYVTGTLSFATGVVMSGAPLVGFILLSRRVMLVSTSLAFVALLLLNLCSAYGLLPYAPGILPPHDHASALLWTHSAFFLAGPHIFVNTVLSAVLLGQWRRREANVLRLSLTDVLTQVHNRRSILEQLETAVARSRRSGTALAIALLDLDHFKRINDRWGHPMGDRVLQEAARVLQDCIRDGDAVGRFGGEEFLLLLPGASREGAERLVERCRARLAALQLMADNGEAVPVSASFGLACTSGSGRTTEALVRAADTALYQAKQNGRNRVELAIWAGESEPLPETVPERVPGRPWWQSRAGWMQQAAGVREWSPVAKAVLVLGLLLAMHGGFCLWLFYVLHRADRQQLVNVVVGESALRVMAALVLVSCTLLAGGLLLRRRRQPDSCWFQYLTLHYYGQSMIWIGYILGALYLPSGVLITSSPLFGFILFRHRIVLWAFAGSLLSLTVLAYAGALGRLPYAPLVSLGSVPAFQLCTPFWVASVYLFFVLVLAVVLVLSDQIFGRWREREAAIRTMSLTDALTQVHNRRSILGLVDKEVARASRSGAPLAVALLDLDHFKKINDTWGHPTGDRVLQEAVRILKASIRDCDAVGRYGGEEFLLLLPDTPLHGAAVLIERCRAQLAAVQLTADNGDTFSISGSFGLVSSALAPALDGEALTRAADAALYRAKASGRNRVETVALA